MADAPIRILLVGHCGPDSYALRSAVGSIVPTASVEFSRDDSSLRKGLSSASLLLVNRVLDGDYPLDNGIELIQELARVAPTVKTMLISNFPEAQTEAVSAGALPGFGKREMYSDETRRKIRTAVGLE